MYEQNARHLVELAQKLKILENIVENHLKDSNDVSLWSKSIPVESALTPYLKGTFKEISKLCKDLDLKITGAPVMRISSAPSAPTYGRMVELLKDISSRMADELEFRVFIAMTQKELEYYEPEDYLFGVEFDVKFASDGVFELDEAAKCLAIGRSTASVFHFMRLMEIGIRALARCLQIPDPTKPAERNWGRILGEIKKAVDARWPNVMQRSHGDGALFEQLYASLDAVRNPWRNATMHVEKKYTYDEAEHIFIAVKGFMMKLSSRMDENGDPKA